jgi:predicted RNA binding protein YcfA (HicA-like mRNA interferase family)
MKAINLRSSLFDITEQYPELIPVLAELGFLGVTNEQMRTTHARVMTIPKSCEQLGIDLKKVVKALEDRGFTVSS